MKVLKLNVYNIKVLKSIEITPGADGNIILFGENGHGKSSVLDAVWLALDIKGANKNIQRPVRDGQDEAFSFLELGDNGKVDLIVKRSYKDGVPSLVVTDANGNKKSSPQTLLDKLCGHLGFDPMEFTTMDDAKRRKVVMELTGLDFTEVDADHKLKYDERTDINVQGKAAKITWEKMPKPDDDTPTKVISISDLAIELVELGKLEKENIRRKTEWEREDREAQSLTDQVETIYKEIGMVKEQLKKLEDLHKKVSYNCDKACVITKAPRDFETWTGTQDIHEKIKYGEAINARITAKREYVKKEVEVREFGAASNRCTATLVKIEAYKQKMIQDAKYPLDGLSVSDDGVLYQGTPFGDLGAGKMIKVSTAMAMAMNPELRLIMVRDAALLDKNNLQAVLDMAKEKDYQVFVEMMQSDDESAIHLLEGEIVGQ